MNNIRAIIDAFNMQPTIHRVGEYFSFSDKLIHHIEEKQLEVDGKTLDYFIVYDEDYNVLGDFRKASMNVIYTTD